MSDSFAHCWAQPYIYRNLRFQDFATAATVLWATGNKYNTWKYLKTYSWMGKFICVITCIAICLISWICNSWIRILAGCLLCTAHCLWFPAYLQAFLSYCLLLLVFVVTRECGSPGLQHGPLRAPKTFQSLSKPSKTFQHLWKPFKSVYILTRPIKTFEFFLILWI